MLQQATIFKISTLIPDSNELESMLSTCTYSPIGATSEKSIGFTPPRGEEKGVLVENVGGQYICSLIIETKNVPASILRKRGEEQCREIEKSTGRKPGKRERRDIMDDIRMSLLPTAFPKSARICIWIDPVRKLMVIGSSTQRKLDEVITALMNCWEGLVVSLIQTSLAPQAAMTQWLLSPNEDDWPQNFSIERECVLKSTAEDSATVRFSKHHLVNEDVRKHVLEGKLPQLLAMSWDGRVSFTLNHTLSLKKLQFLDGVLDDSGTDRNEDRFDADVALTTGLLAPLITDLIAALGGEMPLGGPNQG